MGNRSFVPGNHPFAGAKFQRADQRAQGRGIASLGKNGGMLDCVAAWFIEAGKCGNSGDARIGFDATNSIKAGQQVAQLRQVLFGTCKLEMPSRTGLSPGVRMNEVRPMCMR
ncbi:MAG: hypothetical protein OXL68_09220 [Paracoccaceae bacterium]|nr:hypothetical protein [Paracoccaceae bacterium]